MLIKVHYLKNLQLEAIFDEFQVLSDQPERYKGDGMAPGPFDYFLASSAMCAAYFVKVYCNARNISTDGIEISQNNLISPENRYKQSFEIDVIIPEHISEKDCQGILKSIDRCTVKRVIQNNPDFNINLIRPHQKDLSLKHEIKSDQETYIPGKDAPLERSIQKMSQAIERLGIALEIHSWRNPVPHVWSVHLRDADCPINYTNGKGQSKEAALASALGEFIERISNNYFYNDYYLGKDLSQTDGFVHYPQEKWFKIPADNKIPEGLMDDRLITLYSNEEELNADHIVDTNSGNFQRGICALPFVRQSDQKTIYIPVNILGNLYVSNGMSAGNTMYEARVQCLSEIFERAIKNEIIAKQLTLPDVPKDVVQKFPKVLQAVEKLEKEGFPVLIKDASLGGKFPVAAVGLLNRKTGGAYLSFGAHPLFEVALERSLTELLQGRSFEGLDDLPAPTFNETAITEPNNLVDHFVDSSGIVSWKFFSDKSDYPYTGWNFKGSGQQEFEYLMNILTELDKEVYIADFEDFGIPSCRIIVPDFSEVYPIEDLVWDNHNRGATFRESILNIHQLSKTKLNELVERLNEQQVDEYQLIGEFIGIAFDEVSVWGQLVVAELKCLIYIKLQDFEQAQIYSEMLINFNNHSPARQKFFQALNTLLELAIRQDQDVADYHRSLELMYGKKITQEVIDCLEGKIHFHGLSATDMNLSGIRKHQELIASYHKLRNARKLKSSK